jgi:hypothetical protein
MALREAKKYEAEFDELQARFDNLAAHSGKQSEVIDGLVTISSKLAATHPDKELVAALDKEGDELLARMK